MMITVIGLISRQKMEDFRIRHGGFTFGAIDEILQLDRHGTQDIVKRLPSAQRGVDSDRRYNERAQQVMERVLANATQSGIAPAKDALIRALSFYWPLVPTQWVFDDSGGSSPAKATVLHPQRCRHLLDCWHHINFDAFEHGFTRLPTVFQEVGPGYVFENSRHLIEYLNFYAGQLAQCVNEDRYYATFFA